MSLHRSVEGQKCTMGGFPEPLNSGTNCFQSSLTPIPAPQAALVRFWSRTNGKPYDKPQNRQRVLVAGRVA